MIPRFTKANNLKTFSVDAETDGLYGKTIAIGVVVSERNKQIAQFSGRISSSHVTNKWVIQNVLPAIADMPIEYETSQQLEDAFWKFWMAHKKDCIVIAHVAYPVETGLFRRCVEADLSREFEGPYPAIHDVATLLLSVEEQTDSVDEYIKKFELPIPSGSPHNPLYDAIAATTVWNEIMDLIKYS